MSLFDVLHLDKQAFVYYFCITQITAGRILEELYKHIMMQEKRTIIGFEKAFSRFLLTVIGCCLFLTINSSSQWVTWQRIYNGPYPNLSDYGYDICKADSGNFFVVGSVFNQQIYVLKINSLGDTLWTKLIGTSYSIAWSVVESDSGSCVLTGQTQNLQAFTIKLDRNGNIIWKKYYGGSYVQMKQIIRTLDGGYIMCGRENFNYGVIVKLDISGNLIWKRLYPSPYLRNFQSITNHDLSNFILTGYWKNSPQEIPLGTITIIDSNGMILNDTTFRVEGVTSGFKIIRYVHGFMLGGEADGSHKTFVARIDLSGRIGNIYIFDTTYSEFDFADLKIINDNRFILATSRDTTNNLINGKVMIIDTLGNVLRQKAFTSSKQVRFGGIQVLGDTGFIIAGTIDNNAPSDRDVYIVKIDTLLNAPPPNGIQIISSIVPQLYSLRNYPNPFNPVTNIEFGIPVKSKVNIIIYDINGKQIDMIALNLLTAGTYGYVWDGQELGSGIYFAVLSINGKISKTIKLILLK